MDLTVNNISANASTFLTQCKTSSQHTIEAFENLLDKTLQEDVESIQLLHELMYVVDNSPSLEEALDTYYFCTTDLQLDATHTLKLLHFPSTFLPESWSFTFYEGLSRYQASEFWHKQMVELGCGNGWITIALTQKYLPQHMFGFDINSRAVLCAKINAVLNSYDSDGNRIEDEEGKTIAERTSFFTSDLLGHCLENNIKLDRIIGCIPQVLNPDPELTINLTQQEDDDFLLSLSNYCEKQGYVEDQFGLGLIAKTLEQSLEVLNPSGKLILNMGGRPGRNVLDRLFERRGFEIKRIWNRMIEQAGDTEITPLVDIEKQSAHRFEFFMEPNGTVPISAKTAYLHAKNGGKIYHALTVVESKISQFSAVKKIFSLLNQEDFSSIKPALDLAYTAPGLKEEKLSFLEFMAEQIVQTDYFPYNPTAGEYSLRQNFQLFLQSYYNVMLDVEAYFVGPNTQVLVRNLLHNYNPSCAIVDRHFSSKLPSEWMEALPEDQRISIIEAPTELNLVCKLIESVKPDFVAIRLTEDENRVKDSFLRLIEVTQVHQTRVLLDISNHFDLSSSPKKNAVFNYLAEQELPLHISVLCGLEKNQVYQDLELGFIISRNQDLITGLTNAAELTYSRTPVIPQLYYTKLVQDLLDFHMPTEAYDQALTALQTEAGKDKDFIQIKPEVQEAYTHPSITGNLLELSSETIRLDYGENELFSPTTLKASLYESFARQQLQPHEVNPAEELCSFALERFAFKCSPKAVLLGNGVAPIFSAALKYFKREQIHLLFPKGTYGYFVAAAQYFGVPYTVIETKAEEQFKITLNNLTTACTESNTRYALFFNAPVVNPTGAVYSDEETSAILQFCKREKHTVLLDTIFSGLEHENEFCTYNFGQHIDAALDCWLIGGVAKEFAAGGLRLGYALASNAKVAEALEQGLMLKPHKTITYAFKKTMQAYLKKEHELLLHLKHQKQVLKERYDRLSACLKAKGWEVLPASGGLFMVAKPTQWIGKTVNISGETVALTSENINAFILQEADVLINNSAWTELPGYCRFVLSVEESRFNAALKRLEALPLPA